ncbi:hypothetical protein ABW19_dt0200803 [Dactylella cylindrospora]|nr:hypothetical protein ABW19_dt0200803 [Dactylella cylindrospora]
MVKISLLVPLTFAVSTYAQTQTLWGQCYGVTYKGPIICPSGAACTTYNPYYGQCVPAPTPITTPKPTTTTSQTCKTSTTLCTNVGIPCGTATTRICQTYCVYTTLAAWPTAELAARCIPVTSSRPTSTANPI